MLSLIAAVAENGVIGRDGGLPWHLPDDLKRFKRLTMGHTLIMGRRTFESIGRPLPGRRFVVLSRNPAFRADGVETAPDLDAALALATDDDQVFVAGGAAVYAAALPRADRLYLTQVHARVEGDTTFPTIAFGEWQLVRVADHAADERHPYRFTFHEYHRRQKA